MFDEIKVLDLNINKQNIASSGDVFVVHEGNVWIKCKFCEKVFAKMGNFSKHVLSYHCETGLNEPIIIEDINISSDQCETTTIPQKNHNDPINVEQTISCDFELNAEHLELENTETVEEEKMKEEEEFNDFNDKLDIIEEYILENVNTTGNSTGVCKSADIANENKEFPRIMEIEENLKDENNFLDLQNLKNILVNHNDVQNNNDLNLEKLSLYRDDIKSGDNNNIIIKENLNKRIKILKEIVVANRGKRLKHTYKCEICEKIYPKPSQLFYHFDSHLKSDVFLADKIHELMKKAKIQKRIKKTHPCEICKKVFTKPNKLLKHFRVHEKQISSKESDEINEYISYLNVPKKFKCLYCSKTFDEIHDFREHRNSHAIQHKCKICDQLFRYTKDLKNHMLLHGDDPKNPYKCADCSKSYVRKPSLVHHMRYVHLQKRDHVCTLCEKNFMRKDLLALHMKIHTGDRPYVCEQCGAAFPTSTVLKYHNRDRHSSQ